MINPTREEMEKIRKQQELYLAATTAWPRTTKTKFIDLRLRDLNLPERCYRGTN
jgi:hypothetical protein